MTQEGIQQLVGRMRGQTGLSSDGEGPPPRRLKGPIHSPLRLGSNRISRVGALPGEHHGHFSPWIVHAGLLESISQVGGQHDGFIG